LILIVGCDPRQKHSLTPISHSRLGQGLVLEKGEPRFPRLKVLEHNNSQLCDDGDEQGSCYSFPPFQVRAHHLKGLRGEGRIYPEDYRVRSKDIIERRVTAVTVRCGAEWAEEPWIGA
jgi:hypothetical protein